MSPAPLEAVWDVLLDGRRWSFWNPGVEWLWVEGEAAPGALATIKFKRVRQTAIRIEEIVPPQRFALRLTIGPVAYLHVSWTLTPEITQTRIDSLVTIGGIGAGLLLKRSAERLARALPASLQRLAEYSANRRT